jgi:hypothetical protein
MPSDGKSSHFLWQGSCGQLYFSISCERLRDCCLMKSQQFLAILILWQEQVNFQ